ncbi:DsbC family protein [Vreelandella subglaciescola]|jgi:thiol:disulfide interchange protein DsbC|uniref:Thiol:disulfide interchange protein n=1 Tax=Vreelandella subglaciescola TaxID=29571 RepID=A0A1M7G8X8_9GAMM|nr:DsbC family protein [Halomonas subglaciescola]SHM12740.1 Thiol:disulfide interchange protein DsbC [Halomonas subglaciescola]
MGRTVISVRNIFSSLVLAGTLLPALASAQTAPDTLTDSLRINGQKVPVADVSQTPMDGLYHVQLDGGESFYANADGSYFVVGDLYQNDSGGLVNLSEQDKNQERVAALAAVPESERVVSRGVDEPKATITVFTDTSCPYCTRLHESIPELNERGIAVHYLAFPRGGMQSPAARVMQQAWCSDNPGDALSQAFSNETLAANASCDNPVAKQYALGLEMGVQGTPAIILPDGKMVPGFVPPKRLSAMLGLDD